MHKGNKEKVSVLQKMILKTVLLLLIFQMMFSRAESKLYLKLVIEKGDIGQVNGQGTNIRKEANEPKNKEYENMKNKNQRK